MPTSDPQFTANLVQTVGRCALSYLQDSLHLTGSLGTPTVHSASTVALRGITAVMGLGGSAGLAVLASFESSLAQHILVQQLGATAAAEIDPAEGLSEAAAEALNIILGHCTAYIALPQTPVSLTPPFVIQDADRFRCPRDTMVVQTLLHTPHGNLTLNFVGPAGVILAAMLRPALANPEH